MGDRVGLFVMVGVVVLLCSILWVMRPRRRTQDSVEHETLNPEVEAADGGAVAPPDPAGRRQPAHRHALGVR